MMTVLRLARFHGAAPIVEPAASGAVTEKAALFDHFSMIAKTSMPWRRRAGSNFRSGAKYLVILKANQPALRADRQDAFEIARAQTSGEKVFVVFLASIAPFS